MLLMRLKIGLNKEYFIASMYNWIWFSIKKEKFGPLKKSFNLEDKENLRAKIARMFYSAGLPFHLTRNLHYVSSYSYVANHNISGFLPPVIMLWEQFFYKKKEHILKPYLNQLKVCGNVKGLAYFLMGGQVLKEDH